MVPHQRAVVSRTWQGITPIIAPIQVIEPPSPPPRLPLSAPPPPPALPPSTPASSSTNGTEVNATTGLGSEARHVITGGGSSSSVGIILAVVGVLAGLAALYVFVLRRRQHAESRSVWLATLKPGAPKPAGPPHAQSDPLPTLENHASGAISR